MSVGRLIVHVAPGSAGATSRGRLPSPQQPFLIYMLMGGMILSAMVYIVNIPKNMAQPLRKGVSYSWQL